MGLIQRVIEAEGMTTISISSSLSITRKVRPPRALFPGLQMGHPVGFPGQIHEQQAVLRLLLKYLQTIKEPGTIVEVDLTDPDHPKRFVSHVDET